MKKFSVVKNASGKEVTGFISMELDGKTLVFSKDKRPDLWAEYQASLAPKEEPEVVEELITEDQVAPTEVAVIEPKPKKSKRKK